MKKYLIFSLLAVLMVCSTATAAEKKAKKALPQKEMALQLYSIRTVFSDKNYAEKHAEIFNSLKKYGYSSVEAASYNDGKFYGVTPEQFKSDLAAAGLTALSSHTTRNLNADELAGHNFTEALKWWDKAIVAHKAAGMTYIVAPSGTTPKNATEAQTLCDYLNAVGAKCKEAGLKFGYHSHSFEYKKIDGTDTPWIQYMMEHIDPANMFWQMDVYWCVMAQESPVEWFKKYPGRNTMLHIKDKYEIGQSGMVNFQAIFKNAALCGLKDYVVELERTDGTIDIMEGVKRSATYLRKANYVKASYK